MSRQWIYKLGYDENKSLEDLPLDLVSGAVMPFVGPGSYLFVAGVSTFMKRAYSQAYSAKTSCVQESFQCLECAWAAIRKHPDQKRAFMFSAAATGSKAALMLVDDIWGEDYCTLAAQHGQLETLQWLSKHECQWSARTCETAAGYGHIETLKWARNWRF